MTAQKLRSNSVARSASRQSGAVSAILPVIIAALVVAAALYSFSPRQYEVDEETRVRPTGLLVTGLARSSEGLLAAGEQGHLLRATSPEGPWLAGAVEPQRGSNFIEVLSVSPSLALAVGHDSWIVRSTDGGKHWKEVYFDPDRSEPLLAVAGPFDGRIIAIGGFGQYLYSDDQGQSWQRETHEALGDYHLNNITRLRDGRLLLAAERGLMALSEDAGRSWTRLPEIYPGSFFGALPLCNRGAVVFGMRGNAFYSKDLVEWEKSDIPGKLSLFGGTIDDDGAMILVADDDTVLRSEDGGKSFRPVASQGRQRLVTVLPIEGEAWLVAGEAGIRTLSAGSRKGDES